MSANSEVRRSLLGPGVAGVLGFTACYMLAALLGMLASGNREFGIYFVIMCVLTSLVFILHRVVSLSVVALWGLSAWGLLHFAGGLVHIPASWPQSGDTAVLYNLWLIPGWLKFDQLVHVYGFGLATWICWQTLRSSFARRGVSLEPRFGLLTLCVAAGMGLGALNEVIEFVATLTLPNTNVGGYINTGWDLVANLVGGVIAAILIFLYTPKQQSVTDGIERDATD